MNNNHYISCLIGGAILMLLSFLSFNYGQEAITFLQYNNFASDLPLTRNELYKSTLINLGAPATLLMLMLLLNNIIGDIACFPTIINKHNNNLNNDTLSNEAKHALFIQRLTRSVILLSGATAFLNLCIFTPLYNPNHAGYLTLSGLLLTITTYFKYDFIKTIERNTTLNENNHKALAAFFSIYSPHNKRFLIENGELHFTRNHELSTNDKTYIATIQNYTLNTPTHHSEHTTQRATTLFKKHITTLFISIPIFLGIGFLLHTQTTDIVAAFKELAINTLTEHRTERATTKAIILTVIAALLPLPICALSIFMDRIVGFNLNTSHNTTFNQCNKEAKQLIILNTATHVINVLAWAAITSTIVPLTPLYQASTAFVLLNYAIIITTITCMKSKTITHITTPFLNHPIAHDKLRISLYIENNTLFITDKHSINAPRFRNRLGTI